MTTEMTLPQQEDRSLAQRLTPAQVKADYDLVLQVMGGCMAKDQDYGIVPGTDKPSLWKPGGEKLMLVFRLSSRPTVEDLSGPDERRYRVMTEIIHVPSGNVVAYGVGEASTNEAKWKWRKAVKEEWDETPEDRRRKKYGKTRDDKTYTIFQVRTEPADLANTVLKMADKRSFLSGILKATAASSVFTQDLEDMDEDVREAVAKADQGSMPPIPTPQRKSEASQQGSEPPPESRSASQDAPQTPNAPKKAPESFKSMNSKVDGGSCDTCHAKIAMGDPIWFDTKGRRAHCGKHFA
jgi:hypothetical protein